MAVDPVHRLLEIQVQERLCQMFSSDFDNVTGWELNPLISLLQTIREEYSFAKPDVYKTVIAVLQDYKPVCGEKHREKTLRYLKLLLSCKPELADYMSRILPLAMPVSAQYSHCLQSALEHSTGDATDRPNRHGESTETSPVKSSAAVISTSSSIATVTDATFGAVPSFPTSGALVWPIAAHAAMQPVSSKVLAKAVGLASLQRETEAENLTTQSVTVKTVATSTDTAGFTLAGSSGKGRGRIVAVNKTPSGAGSISQPCIVVPTSGKAVPIPRCLIVRPVTVAATTPSQAVVTVAACRPVNQSLMAIAKPTVETKQQIVIPAVHAGIRQILVPRVIPQATFSILASTTGCRIVPAKSAVVSRPQRPLATSTSTIQSLLATKSTVSSQPATAEESGKASPLSCVQTLVANATTARQWIAVDNKTPEPNDQSKVTTSSDNEMIIHLSVSEDDSSTTVNTDCRQASCFIRKRLSETDETVNKVAKQS